MNKQNKINYPRFIPHLDRFISLFKASFQPFYLAQKLCFWTGIIFIGVYVSVCVSVCVCVSVSLSPNYLKKFLTDFNETWQDDV